MTKLKCWKKIINIPTREGYHKDGTKEVVFVDKQLGGNYATLIGKSNNISDKKQLSLSFMATKRMDSSKKSTSIKRAEEYMKSHDKC
ncbi:MAG: hypothetical protein AABY22_16890 [Nanoarchaeota archaeon]